MRLKMEGLCEYLSCVDLYVAACACWAQIYGNHRPWSLQSVPYLTRLLEILELKTTVQRACHLEGVEGSPFLNPKPVHRPGATAWMAANRLIAAINHA